MERPPLPRARPEPASSGSFSRVFVPRDLPFRRSRIGSRPLLLLIGGFMRNYFWLSACVAIVAAALVAGCGGGGSSTSTPATSAATTPTSTSASSSTTTEASGQATPDDVYNACLDAIQGTVAEQAAKAGCAQPRDAF